MGLTQTAEGLLELLPHFKGFSDREAALFSTVSSFTHACVCVCVCFWYMCACPQGMKTPVLLFHKARTLFYISAEDKYTYAVHPLFSTGELTHSTGVGLF